MQNLKYEHQSTFLLCGRVKFNFRDRYRKPNIYSKSSSCYQVFSSNSHKMTLWCKKIKHYSPRWICMTYIWFSTEFPRGIKIFQGVLTKFSIFLDEISISAKKIVNLMRDLKYDHQSTFPLWGMVKLNFRDRYRKPNIFSKNSSCDQVFHQILKNCHFGVKKNHYPFRSIHMTCI